MTTADTPQAIRSARCSPGPAKTSPPHQRREEPREGSNRIDVEDQPQSHQCRQGPLGRRAPQISPGGI